MSETLPDGWREEQYGDCARYWWTPDDDVDMGSIERVLATADIVKVFSAPKHWPPIPLPVLLRAAVQCHRLREA